MRNTEQQHDNKNKLNQLDIGGSNIDNRLYEEIISLYAVANMENIADRDMLQEDYAEHDKEAGHYKHLNRHVKIQEPESDDIGFDAVDAQGALGNVQNNTLGQGSKHVPIITEEEQDYPFMAMGLEKVLFTRIDTPSFQKNIVQKQEDKVFQADILISNATSGQRYINAEDHIKLDLIEFSKTVKLRGDDLNLNGMPDGAFLVYKYKSLQTFQATVKSDWNDIKNIELDSDDLQNVTLRNFVHADVSLTGTGNAKVNIIDAKRGFVETGEGNDKITIKALSNGAGWSNTFEIDSGAGHDKLGLKGYGGYTIFDIDTGSGNDKVSIKEAYKSSETDLGEGNDRFNGGDNPDTVFGGSGNDILYGRGGDDVLFGGGGKDKMIGGQGADRFVFTKEDLDQVDTIKDFNAAEGDIIELRDILIGFDPLSDVISDYVSYKERGKHTRVSIDRDGLENNYDSAEAIILSHTNNLDVLSLFEDSDIIIS